MRGTLTRKRWGVGANDLLADSIGISAMDFEPFLIYPNPMSTPPQSVKRRHVFYVPGYDPMPPRRYRELYRTEGIKQAAISGYDLKIEGSTGQGERYHWNIETQVETATTHSRVEFLLWNDIVFQSMDKTIPQTYWLLAKTLWLYISAGTLGALFRLRRAPIIAALYPAVVLIVQILVSAGAGALAGSLIGGWIGVLVGLAVFCAGLVVFRRLDKRFFAYYLLHDFAFWAQARGEMPPPLKSRVEDFVSRIEEALDSDADEVMLVGHSSGAHLAVMLLAEVIRRRAHTPKLVLLTLGQAIPVTSFLPDAWDLRRDLQQVAARADCMWLDVSAPGDGACFALTDPVAVSGVAPVDQHGPLVISAAFTHTLSAETKQATKWKFFRRHIQYLCAFDYPKDYDYFLVTAGPLSLRDRFGGRASTPSMVSTPFSPHISIEPLRG